ncbi:hypothetical protein [Thiomicrorhabdus sp. Milos-T2]|uniref:hypothetical protein n=1 Tax=Thiomicrorhabdus sp. Milos-T2 TaxID=90814 RepID=UPI000494CBBE|nr:hypothetical protein [Thiomicrorhabdus sp. Milos-T2]
MFKKLKQAIADDNELDSETLRILSLLFLLLSASMSFIQYTQHFDWWPDAERSFRPGLISTIVAMLLVTPLYIRGILKWNKSFFTIFSLILILLVFSSFVQLAVGGKEHSSIIYSLLGISVVLSWLGIKEIAGFSWAFALASGIYSAIESSLVMDFAGFVYITSGFVGVLLHSGLNPGQLVQGIKEEYSSSSKKIVDSVDSDINSSIDKIT